MAQHALINHLFSRSVLILGGVLLLITFIAYQPSLQNGFINYDDDTYIVTNPVVHQGLTPQTVVWAFRSTVSDHWHPLTWLSILLDVEMFGLNPAGHHFTSMLLHILSSMLLFLVLYIFTDRLWPSFLVALLFGIHPLNVESVAWAAERKNTLSTFFWMLHLLTYGFYVKLDRRKIWGLASLLTLLLGLLSKPMLVTAPFLLLVLDIWPLNRLQTTSFPKLVKEKWLAFVIITPFIFLNMIIGDVRPLTHYPLAFRLANIPVSYLRHIGHMFWPLISRGFYVYHHWTPIIWGAALTVNLTLTAWFMALRKKSPHLLAGWLWYLGTLVPVIGLVQIGDQSMADRHIYIPLIGLFIALAWTFDHFLRSTNKKTYKNIYIIASALMIIFLVPITRMHVRTWKSGVTMMQHAIKIRPEEPFLQRYMGLAFFKQKNYESGLKHFQRANELRPDFYLNHYYIGVCYYELTNYDLAETHLQKSIELNPNFPDAFNVLALLEQSKKNYSQSIFYFGETIRTVPLYYPKSTEGTAAMLATAHHRRAEMYYLLHQHEEAIKEYQQVLRIFPNHFNSMLNLGKLYQLLEEPEQSLSYFQRALRLRPRDPSTLVYLGMSYEMIADYPAARQAYLKAQIILPNNEDIARRLEQLQMKVNGN